MCLLPSLRRDLYWQIVATGRWVCAETEIGGMYAAADGMPSREIRTTARWCEAWAYPPIEGAWCWA